MKTEIKTSLLASAAGMAAAAAAKDATSLYPKVSLSATRSYLMATGCNAFNQVSLRADAATDKDWAMSVPASLLAKFVAALPGDTATLRVTEANLSIESGGANFRLKRSEATTGIVPPQDGPALKVPAEVLLAMLRKTAFAASAERARPHLCGVNFRLSRWTLALTACDGATLAHVELDGMDPAVPPFDVIVPSKTVETAAKLLADEEDEVSVRSDGKKIMLTGKNWCLTSTVVEGKFPEWRKVVPESTGHRALVGKVEFAGALKQAALSSYQDSSVKMTIADGRVQFDARGDISSANTSLSRCRVEDGGSVTMRINPKRLGDIVAAIGEDEFTLGFDDAHSQIKLTGSTTWLAVMMPYRED